MKAIVHDRYGPVEVLEPREIDRPKARAGEVLVRVHAAGLHIGDCFAVRGSPFPVRLMTGLRRPKYGVPGLDFAGRVEALGESVEGLRPGDEVFGVGQGTCAEYARTAERECGLKPVSLTFEEAAALPTSASAALHGLRDAGGLKPGQKVLINGAAGGVGTFAVQIAKALGAEVTGVCSTSNVDLVRSLGADQVIDYTREDFTQGQARYDLILDNIENRPLSEVRRALAERGTLVLNSGTGASGLAMMVRLVRPLVLSPFTGHSLRRYLSSPKQGDLADLAALVEAGKLRPVIQAVYPLHETPAALRHIEMGHTRGKVVVAVSS
ncbi:MAG: NAD(P)-dependent alcohol dehydrogenase [Gemmatimonadetes bacterium]|nr:NAD(P)-dependent alcohol dehydrogenase [Gemmatimonadota bacterium]